MSSNTLTPNTDHAALEVPEFIQAHLDSLRLDPAKCAFVDISHKKEDQCPICQETFQDSDLLIKELGCQHTFCAECFLTAAHYSRTCPMCRRQVGRTREARILDPEIAAIIQLLQESEDAFWFPGPPTNNSARPDPGDFRLFGFTKAIITVLVAGYARIGTEFEFNSRRTPDMPSFDSIYTVRRAFRVTGQAMYAIGNHIRTPEGNATVRTHSRLPHIKDLLLSLLEPTVELVELLQDGNESIDEQITSLTRYCNGTLPALREVLDVLNGT